MTETSHHLHGWFKDHRFLFLLIIILMVFLLHPLVEDFIRISFILDIFISAILLSAVYAVADSRGTLIFALVTALPASFAHWINWFVKIPALHLIDVTFGAVFLGFASVIIVSHLFKQKRVTADLIRGAICGYFLIGLMWAFVYALLEILHPGSFTSGQVGELDMNGLIYFSFVTLCTTGYGDITPLTDQARFLAILEAVMGQMYLAVNIAALVAIRISQSSDRNQKTT
ncbi:MAG: two pore domain potassium channel family protein [Deltaproteobacteria bacterium]|nr:two pore domain potassium channel family protein [Deltaproteobacteria bacterium]